MKLSASTRAFLQQEIKQRDLPDEFIQTVEQWYFPLAQSLVEKKGTGSLVVSFNGSQGSGKSTLTAFLRLILIHHFGMNTVEISIDDFYLTRRQRKQLASEVHPLLITRGVPGTHDVELAVNTIRDLQNCSADHPCLIPGFNKAVDDRADRSAWRRQTQSADLILFEGWCNHAPVQSEAELIGPVNQLEREEDGQGVWRRYANEQLKVYHQKLFCLAESLVFLQVPSFEKVYEWRGLQEQKLRRQSGHTGQVMSDQQLRRFIEHYERITRSCLKVLPQQADVVLKLGDDHQITARLDRASDGG